MCPAKVKPTANYLPKLPSRTVKTRYFGVVTAPLLTNESLIPMSLTVHGGKTTTKLSSTVACIEEQKSEIETDDLVALVGGQDFLPCSL